MYCSLSFENGSNNLFDLVETSDGVGKKQVVEWVMDELTG